MRLLVEIFIIGAVMFIGWSEPFSGRFESTRSLLHLGNDSVPAQAGDRSAYNSNRTFSGHITYKDEKGKAYWLDARGNRHYQP